MHVLRILALQKICLNFMHPNRSKTWFIWRFVTSEHAQPTGVPQRSFQRVNKDCMKRSKRFSSCDYWAMHWLIHKEENELSNMTHLLEHNMKQEDSGFSQSALFNSVNVNVNHIKPKWHTRPNSSLHCTWKKKECRMVNFLHRWNYSCIAACERA